MASRNPMTLTSSPRAGSFFFSFVVRNRSDSRTSRSVSEYGANPTPKEVSLERTDFCSKTPRRSTDPAPILQSQSTCFSTSRWAQIDLTYFLAASMATCRIGSFSPSTSVVARPTRRMYIGAVILPPPNFGSEPPPTTWVSSVLWWRMRPYSSR